jgi:pimeloyl-ACP methyl ester carboxylesterase
MAKARSRSRRSVRAKPSRKRAPAQPARKKVALRRRARSKPKTFVLVHGAWHGGWCWRDVARLLRARGHTVYTPTLTGVGERSHLMSSDINLDTHITDIVNVIKWEDLEGVVLVGHSYGGWVISGVVEQVLPSIGSIVYLDAFMPEDGQTGFRLQSKYNHALTAAAIEKGDITRPPPSLDAFGLSAKHRPWVASKLTPQPVAVSLQPIKLTGARDKVAKKTYIRARGVERPHYDECVARLKSDRSWRVYELQCGHDVMIEMPERLTQILLEVA